MNDVGLEFGDDTTEGECGGGVDELDESAKTTSGAEADPIRSRRALRRSSGGEPADLVALKAELGTEIFEELFDAAGPVGVVADQEYAQNYILAFSD